MGRIEIICSYLPKTDVFADVGCDHGYCTKYMFDHNLCRLAYISDISAESLKKAETLLCEEIGAGRCIPVVADGLQGIGPCDCVLIAGMGGEEIVRILKRCDLPSKFVLQPMKNTEKVRAFLSERGCRITSDITFEDGKFYDLIAGENRGGDRYSEKELRYGRDNLRTPSSAFLKKIGQETEKLRVRLENPRLQEQNRLAMGEKLKELEVLLREVGSNL